MPQQIQRGPLWVVGRFALLTSAALIVWASLKAPRSIPDRGSLAIARIKQLHGAEAKFHQTHGRYGSPSELTLDPVGDDVLQQFVFTFSTKQAGYFIRAIPVDPRQKSFYSDETRVIRSTPGTQAANSDSPAIE